MVKVFRWVGILANAAVGLTLVYSAIEHRMSDSEAVGMAGILALVYLNIHFLAFQPQDKAPGIIRLYFQRKALEERLRIKALEEDLR